MNKNINDIKLKDIQLEEGIYIPSIEACWLYKMNIEEGNYVVNEEYLNKLLLGKLDFSFELVANGALDNIKIRYFDDKAYSLDIVNVKYTKKYKEICEKKIVEEKTTKELREWSYTEGFKFNNKLMSNWKRSSGKARVGENLFILDSIKDSCLDWARMGLDFKGHVDIASIRAYESLPLSSIITTIQLEPSQILVIDDVESIFDWNMSKTSLIDSKLVTKSCITQEKNSIWDGQGLMDASIFKENELLNNKGMALLRNRFFKCAAFNTNLKEYYIDYCKASNKDYETFTVKDMYGRDIKVKDIKLVTTPSAIKIRKFNSEVVLKKGYDGDSAWLDYYLNNCGSMYGVCKVDKPSFIDNGTKARLSYQMVNTIPFLKDELTMLFKEEKEYVERLKNDLDFFLVEAKVINDENELENDFLVEKIEFESMDVLDGYLLQIQRNSDFEATRVFKDFRRNFINAYVEKLKQGKIRVQGDYCVACGNGLEMLRATVSEFDINNSSLIGKELYCKRFIDGEDVVGFRNPHINCGNVGIQTNKVVKEIDKYFNATNNTVFLNSIKYPTLSTYQGEDFDSDTNLLTNNKIIIQACAKIDKNITPIPVNAISNSGTKKAMLTGANMCEIDHTISQNYIGQVVNLSQEINSYMNHLVNTGVEGEIIEDLYNRTSRLSSISCCEIDKAKKQFAELNVVAELKSLKVGLLNVAEEDNRRIKPYFFKFIGDNASKEQRTLTNKKHLEEMNALAKETIKDKKELEKQLKLNKIIQKTWEDEQYVSMETPMDWLQECIKNIDDAKEIKTIQVIKLVKEVKKKIDIEEAKKVVDLIKELDKNIKAINLNKEIDYKTKRNNIQNMKNKLANQLKNMNMKKPEMYGILKSGLNSINNKKIIKSGIESLTLEILFKSYGSKLLDMFL